MRYLLRITIIVLTVVVMGLTLSNFVSAESYTITDLGALGEGYSAAYGINNSGEVVGSSSISMMDSHAFLYSGGVMTDLGTLGGTFSEAKDINDSGQVVGVSQTSSGEQHAFSYSGGVMTDLGTLPGGWESSAHGINNSGQVVGGAITSSGYTHPFIYSGGVMTDLGTLSGSWGSYANGINNSGQVVGTVFIPFTSSYGYDHAFLYSGGVMTDLGTLGGLWSIANSINDSGQVVGWSSAYSGDSHAFLYSGGVMTDLNDLLPAGSGWVLQSAIDINNFGQITGYGLINGSQHAFLYSGGVIQDLNSLIPAGSGWELTEAQDISNLGQIVGSGMINGQQHAFLMTPVSTQHTLTITKGDTGSGTVTSSPAGIDCGSDCSEPYNSGTSVILTPTPDSGSFFTGWSGDADCTDGSITMDADKTCTALFTLNAYNLNVTINPSGGGVVTALGINCPGDCTESYNYGNNVPLTATPNTGYTFNNWTNCDSPAGNQCTMTTNSDKTVTANFTSTSIQYTLAISKSGEGSVTVVSSPSGIDCGTDCLEAYNANTVVTLTATPEPGTIFTGWAGNADCSDGVVTMDTPDTKGCWATFTKPTLAISKSGNGTGTVTANPAGINCGTDCLEVYNANTVVTLTATPDSGSTFSYWAGNADCSDGVVTMDTPDTKGCWAIFDMTP